MKFSKGDKIQFIRNSRVEIGIIDHIYYDFLEPIAIVKVTPSQAVKVKLDSILPVEESEDESITENELKILTISEAEFRNRASKRVVDLSVKLDDPMVAIIGGMICAELHTDFFYKEGE